MKSLIIHNLKLYTWTERFERYLCKGLNYIDYHLSNLFPENPNLPAGLSYLIRAKNEALNIESCVKSIIDFADEIILIDNKSEDDTYAIMLKLAEAYPEIVKVYQYPFDVPKVGEAHRTAVKSGDKHTLTHYYNWALEKVTYCNVMKWDADFVAIPEHLGEMIDFYKLRSRRDKFSLFYTGLTLFVSKKKQFYINTKSEFYEHRAFSKRHGFKWVHSDDLYCEEVDKDYILSCFYRYEYERPCFFEIKRAGYNEHGSRDVMLDKRDLIDFLIMEALEEDEIHPLLEEFPLGKVVLSQ